MNRKNFIGKCVNILNGNISFSHTNELYAFLITWAKLMELEDEKIKFMNDNANAMLTLASSGFINYRELVEQLGDKGVFQIISGNGEGKIEYFIVDQK